MKADFYKSRRACHLAIGLSLMAATTVSAAGRVTSPDGRIAVELSDSGGLKWAVSVDDQAVLSPSALGLEFKGQTPFGPTAKIVNQKDEAIDRTWDNRFGPSRKVRDHFNQTTFTLDDSGRTFGVIVRAYDDGVAVRYDLPEASKLGAFVMTNELTAFDFAEDAECWAGEQSSGAEVAYPHYDRLSQVPSRSGDKQYLSVVPLLARTAKATVAITDADVLDWPAMFIAPTGTKTVKLNLQGREDGTGLVASRVPRQSPWRVMMIGRTQEQLVGTQLVANLSTPSRIGDTRWIQPGVSAWDPWWTGVNPRYPASKNYRGVDCRGDTESDKEYIDLAAEMGWPYMLIDWFWYQNMTSWDKSLHSRPKPNLADFTKHTDQMDMPELMRYGKQKNVKLLVWAHSMDIKTFGEEKALDYFVSLGAAGAKIDFIGSQSQQTSQWVEKVLKLAADRKLVIDFHGYHHPTGLSRTYPNLLTQEGVLGNEFSKLNRHANSPQHQLTLMFTRALLGPMDYTPGGFLNRNPDKFTVSAPAQVMGTRARQLALTVLYPSPLQVMCDSPANYRGQRGVDFLKNLPSTWDESVVVSADIEKQICVARRSGERWYVAAINLDAGETKIPLAFLPAGRFKLTGYADQAGASDPQQVDVQTKDVTRDESLEVKMNASGGFVAVLDAVK